MVVSIAGGIQETYGHGTLGHGLVGMMVWGLQLYLMVLGVFSNFDSVIL